MRVGADALGDNELVAVVLGSGQRSRGALDLANGLLSAIGGLHRLTRSSRDALCRVPGVGEAQAARLLAAVELGRRTLLQPPAERPQLRSPRETASYLLPRFSARPVEHFGLVLLDVRCRVIRTALLSVGTIDATTVHPREVFREATVAGASSVVLFHNHPSGDPAPEPRRRAPHRAPRARRGGDGHRSHRSPDPRRPSLLQLSRVRWARRPRSVTRLLYLDCFSGVSGDMLLGACLDAGVPLDAVRAALGSLGLDDYACRASGCCGPASRRRAGVLDERVPAGAVPPQERAPHAGAHAPPAPPRRRDRAADRPVGAGAGVARSRHRAGPPAGGDRGGHPPDADRGRAPARGRRARLDRRHRRRRVRARVVRRRSHRRLAAEPRERHGPLRARHVPGAGAGDGAADAGRSGLSGRAGRRADDADRRAARDRLRRRVRADAADARRAHRLRRRPPRLPGSAERAAHPRRRGGGRPRRSRRASGSR